jgi:ubiquinone biosynthesis protein COQ4
MAGEPNSIVSNGFARGRVNATSTRGKSMGTYKGSFDVVTAYRSVSALLADPDDTKQAFRVVQALGGGAGERLYKRFSATDVGHDVLRERRSLLSRLKDTAALQALPQGTLGRAYLDFLRSQKITAEGLVDASEEGYERDPELDEERVLVADRLRDMHDLWHVVAGYRGDLIGEAAVLAFSFAQTKNLGVGLLGLMGLLKIGMAVPGARSIISGGFRRGMRAAWLPGADWESLLARPLADVRRELGLDDPPSYDPIYSTDARAAGILA